MDYRSFYACIFSAIMISMKRCFTLCLLLVSFHGFSQEHSWIRLNLLGYPEKGTKVAVWCSKQQEIIQGFELIDAATKKTVFSAKAGTTFGAYGPFATGYRLDFSSFQKPGKYQVRAGAALSPVFSINNDVYNGTADFCLRYMRQQRSGFNPFLKDSCHTHDGYTLYGPMPDSTHIDVSGGWHDASDYLQYSTTSANATWHLLAAYRDFPFVFKDSHQANGLDGKNGVADVMDEAKWGLDWLLKMHPRPDWLFNQLGDDRDHMGMRIPKEDSFYGRGFERPVYFVSGEPQVRGKFMNATKGTSSTAAKFTSAFGLGAMLFDRTNSSYAQLLRSKAKTAYAFALRKPGVTQTASVRSPYIYAEDNWVDDMELAEATLANLAGYGDTALAQIFQRGMKYAAQEPVTPWMADDTAKHYQWYPFINLGHKELAAQFISHDQKKFDTLMGYYRAGIEKVWTRAKQNMFYRGVPFIWCSNNLTVSFAMQCAWYKQYSDDTSYAELEQANIDWLFGCNPWGTSMVYGLPANGDTPVDPHSAFTHIGHYPIDGGLVDGPVYTSIYKGLIGIQLKDADEYEQFQSDLAVYHDDYGDYSSNEPTMDGTASMVYLLAMQQDKANQTQWTALPPTAQRFQNVEGGFIRGDSTKKEIALVFTGDEFGDGLNSIAQTLEKQKINASFYFTGRFYRNRYFQSGIKKLYAQQNLMGMHSDQHLLYADWTKRSKTLVTKDSLFLDLGRNEDAMRAIGIKESDWRNYIIPPYEWWNGETAEWLKDAGYQVFSFTPGTTSNADYTYPEMGAAYKSSETIMNSIRRFNKTRVGKLNGVVLLVHIGTDPRRKDKLYNRLDELINYLKRDGYAFKRIDALLR
jgi:endoglucanase